MSHFQIKVCGITRLRDAQLAARLGADMIGLIFYAESPRYVSVAKARDIIGMVPPVVDTVGVFVDSPIPALLKFASKCNLTFVQLHGEYLVKDIKVLQSEGLKVIRAFSGTTAQLARSLAGSPADLVMVDNSRGTGRAFSPSAGPIKRLPNFMLSGSVNEENVAAGVKAYSPLVIDVNSSVESAPGIKSAEKLKRFFRICNEIRYGQ